MTFEHKMRKLAFLNKIDCFTQNKLSGSTRKVFGSSNLFGQRDTKL